MCSQPCGVASSSYTSHQVPRDHAPDHRSGEIGQASRPVRGPGTGHPSSTTSRVLWSPRQPHPTGVARPVPAGVTSRLARPRGGPAPSTWRWPGVADVNSRLTPGPGHGAQATRCPPLLTSSPTLPLSSGQRRTPPTTASPGDEPGGDDGGLGTGAPASPTRAHLRRPVGLSCQAPERTHRAASQPTAAHLGRAFGLLAGRPQRCPGLGVPR